MKINFVCLGNICRSPMAEYVMKNLVQQAGLSEKISVESRGTFADEFSTIHGGTCHELKKHGVPFDGNRVSKRFTRADYQNFDLIIGMDSENIWDIKRIAGGDPDNKIFLMMSFCGENRDVDDPYYTDNYSVTYKDISRACKALLEIVIKTRL